MAKKISNKIGRGVKGISAHGLAKRNGRNCRQKKGCMLCDLALAILEEIAPEFEKGTLQWTVVDVGSKEGVMRHAELGKICKRLPAFPSILIDGQIAFDNIPDMEKAIGIHQKCHGFYYVKTKCCLFKE